MARFLLAKIPGQLGENQALFPRLDFLQSENFCRIETAPVSDQLETMKGFFSPRPSALSYL